MVLARLCIVTGAPGAGKTALLDELKGYPFAAVEFDELPEPDGSLLGIGITSPSAEPVWPAYNRLWAKIAAMMLRGGGPVLVLCPLAPDEWDKAAASIAGLPRADWARLDCDDPDRRARLAARGWDAEEIADALTDADELRRAVGREFSTSRRTVADVAAAVAQWMAEHPA